MQSLKVFLIISLFCLIGCVHYTPVLTGDCVDRAVVIRQDLRQQGYEAELILGLRGMLGHCWVKYRKNTTEEWKEIKNY